MAGKRGRSGPPGNLNRMKHGFRAIDRRLKEGRLDGRSAVSRALKAKREGYTKALGRKPSQWDVARIKDAAQTEYYMDILDAYLMGLKSIVRKGRVHPVMAEKMRLAIHLGEIFKVLEPERRVKAATPSWEAGRET